MGRRSYVKITTMNCIYCGKPFNYPDNQLTRRYCGIRCAKLDKPSPKQPRAREYRPGAIQVASGEWALISPEDQELDQLSWHFSNDAYGFARHEGKVESLHRIVLGRKLGRALQANEISDHINGIPWDNRRENLRVATTAENSRNKATSGSTNSSGYKGVSLIKDSNKWRAAIVRDGVRYLPGTYRNKEEAAWMYDQWALELHGDFARTNFDYI